MTTSPALRRFVRRLVEGAHRPPLFEADDGHQYVLKLDTLDPDFPVAELISAHLAVAFGVPIPSFSVLSAPEVLSDALRASGDVDLTEFAAAFTRRGGLCFGSRYLTGPTLRWTPTAGADIADAAATLARVFVFDAFVENTDRTSANNPNLLVSSGQLLAIDHNQALPVVQGVTGKRLRFPFESHIAWPTVQSRPSLLDEPVRDLRRLHDGDIRRAVSAVPAPWWTDPGRAPASVADLLARRVAVSDTLSELQKSLS